MLTEKDYCDYETCVALEELGYPRYCYDNGGEMDKIFRMVTLYNAQKWLREEKDFIVLVDHILTEDGDWCYNITHLGRSAKVFNSYEEALSEGLRQAIEILKEN